MEKTTWTQAEERASKIIGKRKLFGVRSGPQGKRVRMFISLPATSPDEQDEIEEVTILVARVCGKKLDKDGWIIAGTYGFCPVMGLAGDYAMAMGEPAGTDHPHLKL